MKYTMEEIGKVIQQGPYSDNWESFKQYKIPQWYEDAKFGLFIHWGPYSVPGYSSEWYPHLMYMQVRDEFKHHIETYGPHKKFGYKDFIPMFTGEKFDAEQWADLFLESGAKYVMPVAEHHDGFPMYDCSFTRWNAVKMGPKRDVLAELSAAFDKRGLVFTVSNHRAEHWWFFGGGMQFDSDVKDPANADLYLPAQVPPPQDQHKSWDWKPSPDQAFLEDWLLRLCELVDKYKPKVVWFDWWIQHQAFVPYLQKFGAYYYNRAAEWGMEAAINYKYEAYPEGAGVFDIERGQLSGIREKFWQTDTSLSRASWGYIKENDYKTVTSIIGDLVDIVSKNGSLLLNLGPAPDGTIPQQEQEMLREIGTWLKINGEAIYGTRPWKLFGEGPTQVLEGAFTDTKRNAFTGEDLRFTAHGSTLYAIALGWPG